MRWIVTVAVVLLLLAGAGERPTPKQLQIDVRVLERDTAGGECKFVAAPRLVTDEGRPAVFLQGGQVKLPVSSEFAEVGTRLEVLWRRSVQEDNVFVDVRLAITRVAGDVGEQVQLLTEGTRHVGIVKVGETTKLQWHPRGTGRQTWAELRVEVFKP